MQIAPPNANGAARAMRKGGVEPPRPLGHTLLRRARLPFRHFRVDGGLFTPRGDAVRGRNGRACYPWALPVTPRAAPCGPRTRGPRTPEQDEENVKVDYIEESPVRKALTFEVEPERVQQEIETLRTDLPATTSDTTKSSKTR